MTKKETFQKYEILFLDLKTIIIESERRVLCEQPDDLFLVNVNFFVKSYLINTCSYLEAMLQDLAFIQTKEINARLLAANIPKNYMLWRLVANVKDKDWAYKSGNLSTSKKEVSDNLSASPYRTLKLFQKLGVNLCDNDVFEANKDLVDTIVRKRNSIVHHNDQAADISFSDLIVYIDTIIKYSKAITMSMEIEK